jgi:ubiquinone/menaquinone biosynthesis C-methylase UbiE
MTLSPLPGHAAWSASYDDAPNALLELERRTVLPWLAPIAPATVVDVACGTGRWVRYAEANGARAFGLDFCRPMLERAGDRSRLIEAEASRVPLRDGCTDLAICAFAAGYLDSLPPLLGELARITRPRGYVLVTDVHPAAIAGGWTRSFRHRGEVLEIENHAHAVGDYIAAATAAGLALARIAQPALGEPERSIFRECGQEHRFELAQALPAVLAILWRRV